jgi:hypothetical protein
MISPAGVFDYECQVDFRAPDMWRGTAIPPVDRSEHPGLVGVSPEIQIAGGTLTLLQREGWFSVLSCRHYRKWCAPAAAASAAVGGALGRALRQWDTLRVTRDGCGGISAMVRRNGQLIIAIGAVWSWELGPDLAVSMDERLRDQGWRSVQYDLLQQNATLVWIDVDTIDLESAMETLRNVTASHAVVAIAGSDSARRLDMNHRLGPFSLRLRTGSFGFVDIDERFAGQADWLDYLRTIPSRNPDDAFLRFTIDGASCEVPQGMYMQHGSWQFYVHNVFKQGVPGTPAHFAVARDLACLDRTELTESTRLMSAGLTSISH